MLFSVFPYFHIIYIIAEKWKNGNMEITLINSISGSNASCRWFSSLLLQLLR